MDVCPEIENILILFHVAKKEGWGISKKRPMWGGDAQVVQVNIVVELPSIFHVHDLFTKTD